MASNNFQLFIKATLRYSHDVSDKLEEEKNDTVTTKLSVSFILNMSCAIA